MNKSQLAESLGVSVQTVTAWCRRGCPSVEPGGRGRQWVFDVNQVQDWLDGREAEDLNLTEERARLARSQRRRIDLEVAQLEGRLIPAKEVEATWSDLVVNFRARLLGIPTRLAPQLVTMDDRRQIEEVLRTVIYESLKELATDAEGEG